MGNVLNKFITRFVSFSNLSLWWCFGSIAAIVMVVQVLTRLIISMFEIPNLLSFFYVQYAMENPVNYYTLRFSHANICSVVFLIILIHIGKGIWQGSIVKSNLWKSGSLLFVLAILSAFLGYVLPWGNISYWGATVITSLLTVLPLGSIIVVYVWGGYVLNAATIGRFFSLHFLVPIVIIGLIVLHLLFLHDYVSSNNLHDFGSIIIFDVLFIKDIIVWTFVVLVYVWLMYWTQYFMDADNWRLANPSVTPDHIKPEWYFLFAYAVLRCIPNKVRGVLAFVLTIVVFIVIGLRNLLVFFILFCTNYMMLIWLGRLDILAHYVLAAQYFSVLYFWLILC